MILKSLFAGVIAIAFGVLFNVHGKKLLLAGLNSAIGFFVYLFVEDLGYSSYVGMFFASLVISLFAEIFSRAWKVPATVFMVAALIPLVPGGGIFQTVLSALQKDFSTALAVGINTILEAAAIALGIIIISSVLKLVPNGITKKIED